MKALCPGCGVQMSKRSFLDEDGDPVWYCWKCDTERFFTREKLISYAVRAAKEIDADEPERFGKEKTK